MNISAYYMQVLEALDKCEVEYLLVGGHAVNYHGYVRATMDMDIWVNTTDENLKRLFKSFLHLGYKEENCKEAIKYFRDNHIIKLPKEMAVIDVMDSFMLKGDFNISYNNRESIVIGDTKVKVIGFEDLLNVKYKSNRPKDLLDVKELKSLKELRESQQENYLDDEETKKDKGYLM